MSFRAAGEHVAIDLPGGTALFTTRLGGVSEGPYAALNLGLNTEDGAGAVAENRERAAALAGRPLAAIHQVHGTEVAGAGGVAADADAQVTADAGLAPLVTVADCVPIALIAPEAVGVVHAGWRGLHGGIVAKAVGALRDLGATTVAAAVGPAIGPCCYEVGDELRAAFGTREPTLDLPGIAAGQLAAAGVGVGDVHATGLCTACTERDGAPLFFSHRRDRGVTGRQGAIAWRS